MELVFFIKNMKKVMIKVVTSLAYARDMERLIFHFECFQQMFFFFTLEHGTSSSLQNCLMHSLAPFKYRI